MMRTLIVFAREPIPGRTKTRLCPPLDGDTAAALYECFLRDTLDRARQLPAIQPVVAYTPETAGPFFAALAPDIMARPQRGESLGERMDNAFREALVGPHPLAPSPADAGEGEQGSSSQKLAPPLPSQWERGLGGEGQKPRRCNVKHRSNDESIDSRARPMIALRAFRPRTTTIQ